jgi:hypothetical protein
VRTGNAARVLKAAGVTLVCGMSLVCGPAGVTTTPVGLDFSSSPALALVVPAAVVFAPPAPTVTTTVTTLPAPPPAFVQPTSPDQWFKPSGRNQGTEGLGVALAQIALQDNAPLYISEQWGRTTGAATSDHSISRTDSWAVDVAVRGIQQPTPATYEAAKRISTALGEPKWVSGDLTKTINGYRFQVLWLVDGHFNHVHVGIRKI